MEENGALNSSEVIFMPQQQIQGYLDEIMSAANKILNVEWEINAGDVVLHKGRQATIVILPSKKAVFKFERPAGEQFEQYNDRGTDIQVAAYMVGLPVPRLLIPSQKWSGGNYYAEMQIEGKTLSESLRTNLLSVDCTQTVARQIGLFIAGFDYALGARSSEFGITDQVPTLLDFQKIFVEINRFEQPLRRRLLDYIDAASEIFSANPVEKRLIHYDLHSENIMVSPNGDVTVLDFGIIRKESIECALRTLCFRKQPFLQFVINGYKERSHQDISLPVLACHAIAQVVSPMSVPDGKGGTVKMSDEKRSLLAVNVVDNLDHIAAGIDRWTLGSEAQHASTAVRRGSPLLHKPPFLGGDSTPS